VKVEPQIAAQARRAIELMLAIRGLRAHPGYPTLSFLCCLPDDAAFLLVEPLAMQH
jgi:hypothetical protein